MPTKITISPEVGSLRQPFEESSIKLYEAARELFGDVELFLEWNGEYNRLDMAPRFVPASSSLK